MNQTQSSIPAQSPGPVEPVLRKLAALASLSESERSLVVGLAAHRQEFRAGSEIQGEGLRRTRPRLIVSGWACRSRNLSDGRRQILMFLLPGDGIGVCSEASPREQAGTTAITTVNTVDAQPVADAIAHDECPGLKSAHAAVCALEEASLLNHIVRLGRQTAYERTAHLFLELHWRLRLSGLTDGDRFAMPLTQEVLADALGLSVVHVNRTLQQLRRDQLLEIRSGYVELLRPDSLASVADFDPVTAFAVQPLSDLGRGQRTP